MPHTTGKKIQYNSPVLTVEDDPKTASSLAPLPKLASSVAKGPLVEKELAPSTDSSDDGSEVELKVK